MRASATAAEATDTAFAPMRVCVRTRLATENAVCISRFRYGPVTPLVERGAIGVLQLAEDLRLAQHQRVQAAGDGEHVLDRRRALQPIQAAAQMSRLCAARSCQPRSHCDQRLLVAVAVRQYSSVRLQVETISDSRTPATRDQLPQCFRQLLARKYDFFADVDGRGAVIDSDDDEWHAGAVATGCGLSGKGVGMTSYRAQRRGTAASGAELYIVLRR